MAVYKDLPSYSDIVTLAIVLMVYIVMLSVIRENTSETNAEFDARPSVRYIKHYFFGTSDAVVVATALAVVPALDLIDISSPSKVDNFIKGIIANYRPNIKAPKQLNSSNVKVWVNGQISRILGLINSCPASSSGLSNFEIIPGRSSKATIKGIVNTISLPYKPHWLTIIYSFRLIMVIIRRNSNKKAFLVSDKPLIFNESPIIPIPGSLEKIGISKIEYQFFTFELVSRN